MRLFFHFLFARLDKNRRTDSGNGQSAVRDAGGMQDIKSRSLKQRLDAVDYVADILPALYAG